jgi:hypothetical protein
MQTPTPSRKLLVPEAGADQQGDAADDGFVERVRSTVHEHHVDQAVRE